MDAAEAELQARLAAAVHALNHDARPSERLAANQWLLALQRSPQAWAVATSLLAAPDPPPPADLLFFAAQTLRRKIQSPGPALPGPGLAPQLLDALLLAARRFCAAPALRQLLTQICLALAALALRADGGVDGLFARMPHLPPPAVLELLTVLPEEAAQDQAGDTGVDAAARCRFTREVLEFLHGLSEKAPTDDDGVPPHERGRRILRCLLSWVRVGCFSETPAAALATHPLLTFAFNSLQVSFSFEVAIEVMTELVSQHQELPQAFLSKTPYIREVLLLPALANRNEKIIAGLACLMCEVGQAAPALVAEGGSHALALTDGLLRCVAFTSEDWEIAESTLQFWCSLAHFILGIDVKTAKRNLVQELFVPVFSSLLDALLFRAQINTDEHGSDGAPCIPDGLKQFRMNLEELLIDICLLLGAPAYINKLFSGGWDFSSQTIPWKDVEVRMYALSMVADTILQDESSFDFSIIMHFVNVLSSRTPIELNGSLFLIYKSFGDVIGSYSKWLSSSQSNIKPLLLFCASGISKSVSSSACSLALRKLCEDAPSFIHEPQNLEILFWISEGMNKGNLQLEDEEEIISAITHALSSVSEKEIRTNAVKGDEEPVALQAVEFWSAICDEEIALQDEYEGSEDGNSTVQFRFIEKALPSLVPMLLETLLKQEEDQDQDDSVWNISMSGGTCLELISRTVGDAVVPLVMPFVEANITKPDWHCREAATFAFGSILEGPSVEKLAPLVQGGLDFLLNTMNDANSQVKDTTAWTLGRVFELLHSPAGANPIINNSNLPPRPTPSQSSCSTPTRAQHTKELKDTEHFVPAANQDTEQAMAVVLDALASYLQDILLKMAKEEVHLLLGVPNEIKKMGTKLRDLKMFLADADKRNIRDNSVQSWVRELRNAMYDASNILDLCQLKAMEQGPSRDMGCFNPLLFCLRNPLHAHHIGNRIKKLNEKLDDIEKRSKTFNFINLASCEDDTKKVESSLRARRETTGEDEFGVVGEKIEEDTRNLVDLLTNKEKNVHERKNVMVYAIVGVGGIGKTTLAKKIFNHDFIKQEFQKRIWLSVNQEFSDVHLLERTITEAQGNHQAPKNTKAALERTLKDALEGSKTLLVMDDVWDHHAWEKVLKPPLINSLARGSRVLVTTRDDTVARGMMSEVPYHHVDKLELEDAWSLLMKQVVGNENINDGTLKDIGMLIIAKCDGLPLAVKVIGGLLRQKKTTQSEWKKLLNDSSWSETKMPQELNYAVYLSYQDLHPELKSCFLHYALLPKSTMFRYERIVAMWIGEGFVHGNSHELEVLGREYYNELIARNLLEPNLRYADHAVCNMHDVIRSFAQYLTRDEAQVAQKSEAGLNNNINLENVVWLSLKTEESESSGLAWSSLQAHTSLRTLILVGGIKINPGDSLTSFPYFRTLHIEDGNFDLLSKSLVQLKYLRYLCLDGTDTSSLPEKIAKMKLLQCIDVSNCKSLVKLPVDIGKLRQLRYLSLIDSGVKHIPRGFGGLTNLRVLEGFPAHVQGDWCSLEELGSLNQLMSLHIYGLENVPCSSFAINARFREKVHLSHLYLECTIAHRLGKQEEQQQIEKVFDELCPPFLEHLRIEGYFREQLPKWMMTTAIASLGSLRILFMEDLPNCMELPNGLCQLPSLEILQIRRALGIKSIGPEFLRPHHDEHQSAMENFGHDLEIVVINCHGLERISNLPNLQKLVIIECRELKVLDGLPGLKRLTLEDYEMGTLPGYLQNVSPRELLVDCIFSLLASIAKVESGPEWDKFSHIKHVKAYAHDDDNNIERKWYVKCTRDPFSFKTNISLSSDSSVSGDRTKELSLDEVEEISRDGIEEEPVNLEQRKE